MPPRKRSARGTGNTARGRGSRRGRGKAQSAVGDPKTAPYQELLAEVDTAVEEQGLERPLKRRKRRQDGANADSVGGASKVDSRQIVPHNSSSVASVASPESSTAATSDRNGASPEAEKGNEIPPVQHYTSPGTVNEQVVYDDTDSSDDSDADFERLMLEGIQGNANDSNKAENEEIVHATVASGTPRPAARVTPRKHAKAKDKVMRIDIHKVSVLCWLMHGYFRSSWCNIEAARNSIRQVLTSRQRSFLNPDPTLEQNERSLLFQRGLDEACKSFQENFTVTRFEAGSREEFIEAAGRFRGSRHTGNHLFCALLRDAGVRARLVCSLQVTKLTSIVPINDVQHTSRDVYSSDIAAAADSDTASDVSTGVSIRPIKRRLGHRSSTRDEDKDKAIGVRPVPYKRAAEPAFASPYPIYWVEAFSVANQRWLCIDPSVTRSWNKPRKLEPPLYDEENTMTYVMAYDASLCVKDVTRRYAKAYNAKTYKRRIDSTPGGTQWLRRVLRLFRPMSPDDSDQIEDAELARYEAAEPIPNAQQDFKDHPVYALERHLHHNEVVHPRREVGKVLIGKKQEPIYRRSDVHIVRSSDKWYRSLGRQLRIGEQPLKYGKPRRRRAQSVEPDGEREEDGVGAGLYAEFQTQQYVPPPIVDGKIQKNIYRNLDVYVPSMIPAGGAHVRSSDAVQAARLAGIDYAEAVTGFQFKGRKGTAITRGVVVAREYSDAVEAICHGLRAAREDAAAAKQSAEALRMWKKLLLGLRIRERIMAGADPNEGAETLQQRVNDAQDEEQEMEGEGGFLLERAPVPEPALKSSMLVEPRTEIDEIIDAMNRDTGLSRSRAGPTVRREYFEPTIFSPWDVPEPGPKLEKPIASQSEPPHLATEMTNDSLFNDLPGEDSFGHSDDSANELTSDSNRLRHGLNADNLHGAGKAKPAEAEDHGVFIHDDVMDTGGGFIVSSPEPETSILDNDHYDSTAHGKEVAVLTSSPKVQQTDKDSIAEDMDSDMLSHDPEEDDMEEGWLVEETGL